MDPREYLLRYFTDLDKIDIPINVKDNSFGGRLSRLGSRIGTPVKNFLNSKASIPNLLTSRSSTIPSPWGGSLTSSPVVNTLGGEVVDVASSTPKSFLSKVRGLSSGVIDRFAGNSRIQNLLGATKSPVTRRFAGPVLGGTLGTTADLAEGMNPVQAFGRNITGTTAGVLAYPFAEVALPMVPGSGFLGYAGADQLGRRAFDQFYGLATEGSNDPITGGFLGGPLPNTDDYSEIGVPVTEGEGTKLIRTADGRVIRVPVETSVRGSETISEDGVLTDVVAAGEGANASDLVDDFLSRREWEQESINSPARRSGAFTDDQLWELQKRHREWKEDRGR